MSRSAVVLIIASVGVVAASTASRSGVKGTGLLTVLLTLAVLAIVTVRFASRHFGGDPRK